MYRSLNVTIVNDAIRLHLFKRKQIQCANQNETTKKIQIKNSRTHQTGAYFKKIK